MQSEQMTIKLVFLAVLALTSSVEARTKALNPADQFTLSGRVVKVVDGDTIDVLSQESPAAGAAAPPRLFTTRIRLANIDAPESSQAFGARSRENLASLVAGLDVHAQCLYRERRRNIEESRQRAICTITRSLSASGRTIDVNELQIRDGFARYAIGFAHQQTEAVRRSYQEAETSARSQRLGLWRDLGSAAPPVAPWDFRKAKSGKGD